MLSILLTLNIMSLPTLCNDVMPRWENIYFVDIVHGLDSGKAYCYIYINAFDETDRIDNVDVVLYQRVGTSLVTVARWDNLSAAGDEFEFYEIVNNVRGGYTYRLAVTADVHRYGYVETLNTYGDVQY